MRSGRCILSVSDVVVRETHFKSSDRLMFPKVKMRCLLGGDMMADRERSRSCPMGNDSSRRARLVKFYFLGCRREPAVSQIANQPVCQTAASSQRRWSFRRNG